MPRLYCRSILCSGPDPGSSFQTSSFNFYEWTFVPVPSRSALALNNEKKYHTSGAPDGQWERTGKALIEFGTDAVGGTAGPGTENINASFWIDPKDVSSLVLKMRRASAPKSKR